MALCVTHQLQKNHLLVVLFYYFHFMGEASNNLNSHPVPEQTCLKVRNNQEYLHAWRTPLHIYKRNVKKKIQLFLKEYGFSSVVTLSFTELAILTQSTSFHRFFVWVFWVFKKGKTTEKQGTSSNLLLFQVYYPVVTDKQSGISKKC